MWFLTAISAEILGPILCIYKYMYTIKGLETPLS